MQPGSDVGQLNTADWEFIEDLVTRFEAAGADGEPAALEPFLPPTGDPLRLFGLEELIKSDLEIQWRRGKTVTVEDYLKRFPELVAWPARWPALLLEEYRVRQTLGDKPSLADYQLRFPDQFRALQQLIDQSPG